jgi:hypothetical protein
MVGKEIEQVFPVLPSYPLVNSPKKRWKDPPFSMGKSTISLVIFAM